MFPPSLWEESASASSGNESITTLRRRPFPVPVAAFLAPSAFPGGTTFLFFSSPSSLWEECASESSDDESDTTLCRRPFRVPVAFFLVFFTGTS